MSRIPSRLPFSGALVALLLVAVVPATACRRGRPSPGASASASAAPSAPPLGLAEQVTTVAEPVAALRLPDGFVKREGAVPLDYAPAVQDAEDGVTFGPHLSIAQQPRKGEAPGAAAKSFTALHARVFFEKLENERAVALGGRVARLQTLSFTSDRTPRKALRLLVAVGDDLDIVTAASFASSWARCEGAFEGSMLSFAPAPSATDLLEPAPHLEAKPAAISVRYPRGWKLDPTPPEGTVFALVDPKPDKAESARRKPAMLGLITVHTARTSLDEVVADSMRALATTATDLQRVDDARVSVDGVEMHLSWESFSIEQIGYRQVQAFVLGAGTVFVMSGLRLASAWERSEEALTAAVLSLRVAAP